MSKTFGRALCWIRRDLRLDDHRPLTEACASASEVAVVFVFDATILGALKDGDDRRVMFIHKSLVELDERLRRDHGSELIVLHGDPVECIPKLAEELGADAVYAGRDYEPQTIKRDERVASSLEHDGRALKLVKDQVVFESGDLLNHVGLPFKVYTPYSRAWRARFDSDHDALEYKPDLTTLMSQQSLAKWRQDWCLKSLGFDENDLWLEPGESGARARLASFSDKIGRYAEIRDFPAINGTSGLSVHLRFGTVSVRDCVRHALGHGPKGDKWLAELIWREFYQDILAHNPLVVSQTFQEVYRGLDYPGSEGHYQAWCDGQTGYPIVDAAMRSFNVTGWMHNRLRMIVASFLTKDLLVDYRRGEEYFARYLLDFDLASNNGGWQWAASTGVDAQPYFRVFNPILQSKKFDSDGAFIRRWLPELAELAGEFIHWPHNLSKFDLAQAGVELGKTYPHAIVDHSIQRELAIKLLESAREGSLSELA